MYAWWNSLRRDQGGVSAVEFALFLPLLILLLLVAINFGQMMTQANAVEKGMRAGTYFAARSTYPFTTATITAIQNVIKNGNTAGTGPYLAPGWADPAATIDITSSNFALGTDTVPVVRVTVQVPFKPLLPSPINPISNYTIKMNHEQVYVGL